MPRCPLKSSQPEALSRRGWELAQAGDYTTSLACHVAATDLPSATAYDFYYRGRVELQLDQPTAARASYERAVSPRPPLLDATPATEAYFQLGKLARDAGELAAAVRAYEAAVRLGPSLPGAHVMLGVTLRDLGVERAAESLHHYTNGLRIQPAIGAAQYNRAQVLLLSLGLPACHSSPEP